MSNDLEKALELLRQARPRVEGMHLAQGCRADQGHIGLLREIDAFLASHHSVEANDMGRAEGAQGEREAFEAWWSSSGLTKFKDTAQAAWEARAALAQPSPARCQCCGYLVTDSEHRGCLRAAYPVVVTKNDDGQIVAVTRQDAEGSVLSVIAEAQSSPKCATCNDNGRIGGPSFYAPDEGGDPCPDCSQPSPAPDLDDQSFDDNAERLTREALGQGSGVNPNATSIDDLFLDETPAPELDRPEVMAVLVLGGVFDGGELGDNDIVTVNPAIERLQAALVTDGEVLVELMTVAQHERIVTAWRHLKDVKYAELYEEAVQLEAKIDAAQAKLAELERQEPVYTKPSWADSYGWSGGYIDFKCATDVEKLARHFEDLLDAVPEGPLYAAPVAQAGQVPKELREAVEWADHLLFECGALVQTRAPSVHVYNKAFAAIEAAKTLLAGAPAQGGE